jgi:hypothetical protein
MTTRDFEQWLRLYGNAWVTGDPDAAVRLFSVGAAYHEKPFEAPMVGTRAIHRYWTEGAQLSQTDINFEARPIGFDQDTGWAHWRATFRRVPSGTFVELDGICMARFDDTMCCQEFREWWHRREREPEGKADNGVPEGSAKRDG